MKYAVTVALLVPLLSGCVILPRDFDRPGPLPRPPSLDEYYSKEDSYRAFTEELTRVEKSFRVKSILIDTARGPITIDYFFGSKPTDTLIFVFPVLGGKHEIETYFAEYFARYGLDTAIVHRDRDFKRPERFHRLEEVFRDNVIRDRIAMDFFEQEYDKRRFGSFGISRGAINAATTAGVDPRLKYNVLALGGSHLVKVFRKSDVRGIRKYRNKVKDLEKITDEEFFQLLEEQIRTEPRFVAKYMDPANTLMILSVFDSAVPIRYGMRLRRAIGWPRTIFLFSGHYTGLLFTQFFRLIPPSESFCIFPFDFIEGQALIFFNESFEIKKADFRHVPFIFLQAPFELFGQLYYAIF